MPAGKGKKGKGKSNASNARISHYIDAMAWNADHTQVAIGVDKSIVIYSAPEANKKKWKVVAHMEDAHGLAVSDLDWSSKHGKLVSCSHDRNAYVWTKDEDTNEWKPTLAILRISRAALCCKWSPSGKKFAVGSGSKTVPVCRFDDDHNWWHTKMISKKKGSSAQHKSSIVSVAWHPNSQFLATACTDKKCRVWCTYLPELDKDGLDLAQLGDDDDLDFGDCLHEFSSNGWVHDCEFSPDGTQLCFVSHDSTVSVVNFAQGEAIVNVKAYSGLPFTSCIFKDNELIIAAGYDFFPLRITSDNGEWSFGTSVDEMKAKSPKTKGRSAMKTFQSRDTTGQDAKVTALLSKHQMTIRSLALNGETLYSAGSDGRLQFWKL